MAKLSVALAAYNGKAYIRQQMDSILAQLPGAKDELVISDDGSVDGTLDIIKDYQNRDGRIRLLSGPGRGIKQNIANAVAKCQGDYIFLSDQDDVWLPDKVEKMLAAFARTGSHLVVHDNIVTEEDLRTVIYPSFFAYRGKGGGFWSNLWRNKYIGCCMAFSKDLQSKLLPVPDDIQMHDQWFGILNDIYYKDTYFLEEKLIYYRRHGDNVSDFGMNPVPVMIKNRLIFLRRLAQQLKRKGSGG